MSDTSGSSEAGGSTATSSQSSDASSGTSDTAGVGDVPGKLPKALNNIQIACAVVFGLWAVGVLAINVVYGIALAKPNLGASFAIGSAYSAAAFGVGLTLGLLFGIPRSRSSDNGDDSNYTPNTALEQISDWLTKIIVGVGLTQFAGIAAFSGRMVDTMSRGLGDSPSDIVFSASLLVISAVVGFIVSYLLSRTILPYYFDLSDKKRMIATRSDGEEVPFQPPKGDDGGQKIAPALS